MNNSLNPEFLAWREAHIRWRALMVKYRRLCRRPDVPVTTIVACMTATEQAKSACQRLKRPHASRQDTR